MEMRQANRGEMVMPSKTNRKTPKASKTKKNTEEKINLKEQEELDDSCNFEYNPAIITHKALFYDDLYSLFLYDLSIKDAKFYKETKELEDALKSDLRWLGVLILFKRIVPTIPFDDYGPFHFLRDALIEAKYNDDYGKLFVFMRIAETRLQEIERLEENKKNLTKPMKSRIFSENCSNEEKREEAQLLLQLFETIVSQEEYNFDVEYKKTIIPKLIENKEILFRILKKINDTNNKKKSIRKNAKKKDIDIKTISELFTQLYNKRSDIQDNDESKLAKQRKEEKDIITKIVDALYKEKQLSKRIYDQFNAWRNPPKENRWTILPSVRMMVFKPHIEKVYWKKMGPWPINEYMEEYSFEKLLLNYEIEPALFKRKINELSKKIQNNYPRFKIQEW